MADLFLLSQAQMGRIERYFPLSHGIARVDDRRIVSAIVFVIKEAFLGFEPSRLAFEPDEFWHKLTMDARIVRNGAKIMSVRDNARFVARRGERAWFVRQVPGRLAALRRGRAA